MNPNTQQEVINEIVQATVITKMDLCSWFKINAYTLRTKHGKAICEATGLSETAYSKITNSSFPIHLLHSLKAYIYQVAPHLKPSETGQNREWKY